jgi:tetratricopeptide (TPR) repeat protein
VVFDRLAADDEGLVPGIRPAVALFAAVDDIDLSGGDEGAARLNAFVGQVQSVLTRFGGMLVDVTTGDKGVYVFGAFGVPVAHGDDLLRAVSAAEELRQPGVRIGLASGSVYAGVYGAPSRCCYGIKGTTVNVAARLMQEAGSGKVLLSGGFGASTARRFEIRPLPPLFLKGFTDPVPTSELVGPREQRGVRLPEPQYTVPIVGRRSELRRVLAAIRLAAGGQGQVLGISGDPGLGKSRLLAETIQLATAAGFEALVGAASSFGTAVPYLAWRPLWRQFFGLDGDAPPSDQAAELERFLAGIDHALPAQMPLLGPLLGLAIPDNETTGPLPPPARKKLIVGVLLRCVAERAARRPLLLALEDCHWFDSVSLELLADVRTQLSELPVLLVATYRPPGLDEPHELGPDFSGGRDEIELAVFDEEDASELIHLKLGELFGLAGEASPELVRRITERAQGNPFYLEELLNHLSDLGIDPSDVRAVQQVELPTTLHSLILDRLDRLTPDEQLVLKAAAVVGRRFRADWVRGAHPELGTEDDVRKALAALARFDLIAQDAPAADVAYLFKHVATWEAAYQSLAFETRETSHERLASYLEGELGDAAPVELLAQHYGRSRNRGKELEYVLPAGEHAVGQGAYREASQYLSRGLEIVGDLDESPERAARELALQLGLGGVMLTTHGQGAPEAKLCFDRALELTADVPQGPELVRALFGLWTYYLFRGDMKPTDDLARQILGAAEAIAQPEALLQAHFAVSATVYWLGDFAGTVHHADEVARLYDPEQAAAYVARYAQNPRVTAAADAAWAEWIMGHTGAARRRSEETVAHARELGHEFVLTIALQIPAFLSLHMGDVAATAAAAQDWLDTAQRVGNPVYVGLASACLGWAKAASGETEEGLGMLGAVRQGFLDQGVEVVDPLLATAQADAHLRSGQAAAGLEVLEHTMPRVRDKHQVAYLAEQHRLRGELLLVAGGERAAAEDDFRQALAIADEQGARSYALRAAMSLTRLLRGGSRGEEAEALLRSLRALVPEGTDTPDVQLADAILAAGSSPTLEAPIR